MQLKRFRATLVSALVVAFVISAVLSACATTSAPSPQPSASPPASQSPKASVAPSKSPAASAASPSPKALSPEEQAYQKALADWAQVEAAGKKEGKLVVYASPSDEVRREIELFMKAYPEIKTELVGQRGPETVTRIATEISTGQGLGDVARTGLNSAIDMADKGSFVEWKAPNALKPGVKWLVNPYSERLRPKGDGAAITAYACTTALINTEKVPRDKEPKTWMDLVDPFYKDRATMQPLNRSAGAQLFAFVVREKLNEAAFVKGVNDINPMWSTALEEQVRMVITGEKYAFWPSNNTNATEYLIRGDLPIKLIAPGPAAVGCSIIAGVIKTAPHPNAAKLFVNWKLSEQGQIDNAKGGGTPIMAGMPVATPSLDLAGPVYSGVEFYWPTAEDFRTRGDAAEKDATTLFNLR